MWDEEGKRPAGGEMLKYRRKWCREENVRSLPVRFTA
jgi:hypothetical protein